MVVITQFTAVLVGLSTVASAVPMARPPPTKSPRRAFSVNQITRPLEKAKKVNLPGIYANALAKYGGEVPANIKDAASQGSAVATPEQYDLAYLTPVKVGKFTLNLDIDTGSADLWVFSDQLPQAEQTGHDVYTPTSNATKMNGYTWSIQYGDGSHASGNVYKDVVEIGGVTAPRQAVEAASKISDQFVQDRDNDGLLGLSFSSINTVKPQPQTTFFDSVKNDLDSPLFAATLKYHAPGSYDFGYIDKKKYKGSLTYTEVDNTKGFWMFTAGGYGIGDAQPNSNSISGIADTGTTLLLVPDTVVEEYYKSVNGAQNNQQAGGYTFPCKTKLPSFTVVIGEYKAVVPGQYINYAPVSEGGDLCFGGIQSNSGLPFSIFGDIFLKSQYVVFDSQGPRLGFAPQA